MASLGESKSDLRRPRPMKVLVLGLCRTGTSCKFEIRNFYLFTDQLALYVAQKELGMKPYHFRDIAFNTEHMQLWLTAMRAKFDGVGKPFQGKDFDQMLAEYDVCMLSYAKIRGCTNFSVCR